MKSLYVLLFVLVGFSCYGQETYYKNYRITNFIDFLKDGKSKYDYDTLTAKHKEKIKFLSREKCVNYFQLSAEKRKLLDERIKLVKDEVLQEIKLKDCSSNELLINSNNVENPLIYRKIGVTSIVRAKTFGSDKTNFNKYKAGLVLEKNKLYVNLWPFIENKNNTDNQSDNGITKIIRRKSSNEDIEIENTEKESINDLRETRVALFYEIPDDHTAVFKFTEWNVTAITIPLKYRFQTNRAALDDSDENNIKQINLVSEEFSTSVNVSLFGGHSWGKTKFTYRKKVGNRIKTIKNTLGVFLGTTAIEISPSNANVTLNEPKENFEGTIGTISFGLGYVRNWNKLSIGVFYGADKGVGKISNSWVYNGKGWLGVGLGYDLFKL